MNLPPLKRLLMEAGPFKVRGVGRIVGAPNWIDLCFDNYPPDDLLRFVHEFLNAAPDLLSACEERDSLREVLEDKRRLARELDIALHGEEGAAKQASLCDLIVPAQRLREERDRYKADSEALDWFLKEYPEIMTSFLRLHTNRDCPEHLRKRLEGK